MSELWVVETLTDGRWEPCVDLLGNIAADTARDTADRNAHLWQEDNPRSQFRVRKYSREAGPK